MLGLSRKTWRSCCWALDTNTSDTIFFVNRGRLLLARERSLLPLSEPRAIKGTIDGATCCVALLWTITSNGLRTRGIPRMRSRSNSIVRKDKPRSRSSTCEKALSSLKTCLTYNLRRSFYRPRALYIWPPTPTPLVGRVSKDRTVYSIKILTNP
jgi:hypothetical protein